MQDIAFGPPRPSKASDHYAVTNSANDLAGAPFRGRGLLGIIGRLADALPHRYPSRVWLRLRWTAASKRAI